MTIKFKKTDYDNFLSNTLTYENFPFHLRNVSDSYLKEALKDVFEPLIIENLKLDLKDFKREHKKFGNEFLSYTDDRIIIFTFNIFDLEIEHQNKYLSINYSIIMYQKPNNDLIINVSYYKGEHKKFVWDEFSEIIIENRIFKAQKIIQKAFVKFINNLIYNSNFAIRLPLRDKTNKFIGPAETLIGKFLGTSIRGGYKKQKSKIRKSVKRKSIKRK